MEVFKKRGKQKGRWGKKFVDKRDWKPYNEELVVRGEFLLELEWVKSWEEELEKVNTGKKGAPYEFPESLIRLQGVWHQWVDFRGVEGITRKLAKHGLLPQYNDFSTINRRVNKLDIGFKLPNNGNVNVSCDGSGMKLTNRGEYRKNKYGDKMRKYVKVTITADPMNKKLFGCEVCIEGEGLSEPDVAKKHMEEIINSGVNVRKFWGDGSFDKKELFNFCERNKIKTAIKLPKNASQKARGSIRRSREVKEYQKKGYKKWAKGKKYGQRWTGTEGVFSAVKRKFGENVRSRKLCNLLHEAGSKFWAYDRMKAYGELSVM